MSLCFYFRSESDILTDGGGASAGLAKLSAQNDSETNVIFWSINNLNILLRTVR